MYSKLNDKRLLIFGGTGSIGNAILLRLVEFGIKPSLVTVVSRDETKHHYLRMRTKSFPFKVQTAIADIRSDRGLRSLVEGQHYVFAAAAMKHVPIVEEFPAEGIRTNLLGALNILEAVRQVHCAPIGVVSFSTDKACMPECAMGMTKALQERLYLSAAKELEFGESRVNVVRYGNLLASSGSALPVFVEQIKAGKTVTVTHPGMTRFFSFMKDAADLCLTAALSQQTGQLFAPKLRSAYIIDVIRVLADLLDKPKCVVTTIGIRGAEKLHETMLNEHEQARVVSEESAPYIQVDSNWSGRGNVPTLEYVSGSPHFLMTELELREMLIRFLAEYAAG